MRIKFKNGSTIAIKDLGFEVMQSPQGYGAKIKDSSMEIVDFPEEDGEYYYIPEEPKMEAFDYAVIFACKRKDSQSIAVRVGTFIDSLMGKEVTIYNDAKGVSLDGFAISYVDDKYYSSGELGLFKITFKIPNPKTIKRY